MKAEANFLRHLNTRGYFGGGSFDPQPVFEAARQHLGIDVTSVEENERLTTVINRLVDDGILRVEYSQDPTLHPKDQLDHWRLLLTATGLAEIDGDVKRV